jgi:hypothetical protein
MRDRSSLTLGNRDPLGKLGRQYSREPRTALRKPTRLIVTYFHERRFGTKSASVRNEDGVVIIPLAAVHMRGCGVE